MPVAVRILESNILKVPGPIFHHGQQTTRAVSSLSAALKQVLFSLDTRCSENSVCIKRIEMLTRRLLWLTLFALAMANVEATIVVHLRHLYYPENPLAIFPLHPFSQADLAIEMVREAATIVMLFTVSLLALHRSGRRFAAFVYIFGVWDLGYYLWLKLLIDWPQSWLEWDILFLIPWPWFGPWITPAIIALLFTIWGAWVLNSPKNPRFTRYSVGIFLTGAVLDVAAFLWPAIRLLQHGEQAFQNYVPDEFSWPLYLVGLLMMLTGLLQSVLPTNKS